MTTKEEYKDYPIQDCIDAVREKMESGRWHVHQKFTCQHCGSRQTMPTPNKFYATGLCEECDSVTNIEERGCNYMLIGVL